MSDFAKDTNVPINDCISRQAALDALCDNCETFHVMRPHYPCKIYTTIEKLPQVEGESVRHGRWIIKDNPGTGWYRVTCSECGEDVTSVAPVIGFFPNAKVIWDFCPYCGCSNMES